MESPSHRVASEPSHPVCMQNTAEIASSDLLSTWSVPNLATSTTSTTQTTTVNKDKIHEFLSTSSTSSPNWTSVSSNKNKNFKRTKREEGTFDKSYNKHNKSNSFDGHRSARLTDEETDSQFDRHFIGNLLRIHAAYYRPFASYIRNQSEDCLYLNLYVPYNENSNDEQYPVVVFVHGESFQFGTGNAYDGSILAGIGQVIVVTLNYRLGVFGFMPSLIEGAVRTNNGIFDVVASLHWIQDNIAQFGGNTNITLIGHQRGAALVQFLMKSQLSKGLFQRAVLLSGSASSNWALAEQTELYTRMLASKVDCGLDLRKAPEAETLSNDEMIDLFRSETNGVHFNQTANSDHQLSSSDERIFQCLRSLSSEQLRIASIRLTGLYYSPFHSLFGPTIDSLLITDDQWSGQSSAQHTNHSNHLNRKSKFAITNSNHDLLIGYSANLPRLRPALKQMLNTISKLTDTSGLHFFYKFLSEFIRHTTSLIRDGSLNEQNDFNEIYTLIEEFSKPEISNDFHNTSSQTTNWLQTRQNDLLNIISSLLLDTLIVAPLLSTANHHQGSVYAFFLPFEQDEDEFDDQELDFLFGSPVAGYYYNVTDGLGRFRTNQTVFEQVQQSQRFMTIFINFFRNGRPGRNVQDQIPTWPAYSIKSRNYLSMDKQQWKIKKANAGRLIRWLKLTDILDEESSIKNSSLDKVRQRLTNEVLLFENLPSELRKSQFDSILDQLHQQLDFRIKHLTRHIKQTTLKQHFKSRVSFNSSQMNKSNESPDPGGGQMDNKSIGRSSIIDYNPQDSKNLPHIKDYSNLKSNNTQLLTGNLARIKENSLINKIDRSNQTTDKGKIFNRLLVSLGMANLNTDSESSPNGNEKNRIFYTNAMIAIITSGFAMLFLNMFVLVLGYKCIKRRRLLKRSDQLRQRKNSKENLSPISCQTNQAINSNVNINPIKTFNYDRIHTTGNLIGGQINEANTDSEKCYCGGQFCDCTNVVDKLQLINNDTSFFTTDNIITDQPGLTQLVSPVCKLINTGNYESSDINKVDFESTQSIENQLITINKSDSDKQYSAMTNSHLKNGYPNTKLSNSQLVRDEENDLNCITTNNNLVNTPMLAVLDSSGDSNLLTEFGAIDTNLYKFFESNYYAPYDSNNIDSALLHSTNSYQTSIQNALLFGTENAGSSSAIEQSSQFNPLPIRAHTIQLQLLTEQLLNTPTSHSTSTNN